MNDMNVSPSSPSNNKQLDDDASEALLSLATIDRNASWDTIKHTIGTILKSETYKHLLPILISYLRNHKKSVGPGQGLGERRIAERCVISLFDVDHDQEVAKALLRLLVVYGSWKSLLSILIMTDGLINNPQSEVASDAASALAEGEKASEKESTTCNEVVKPKRKSSSIEGPYVELCKCIHQLFATQMKVDLEAVEAVSSSNDPEKFASVSNASKFAPHEKRGNLLTSAHADKIASLLFPQEDGHGDDANANPCTIKRSLRRKYRQLRSKLNEANGRLPDRYLSMHRADELKVSFITEGYLAKCRSALLNKPKSGSDQKNRYDDPGRIDLRDRLLKAAVNPDRVPAPSSIHELAKSLMSLMNDTTESEVDAGEQLIIETTYKKAVKELKKSLVEKEREVRKLCEALNEGDLDLSEEEIKHTSNVVMCVDVSQSQSHAFPVKALLVLLFADTMDALAAETEDEGEDASSSVSPTQKCILFNQTAITIDIPLPSSDNDLSTAERLGSLVELMRKPPVNIMHNGDGEGKNINYKSMVEVLNTVAPVDSNTAVIIASDFVNSEDFVTAFEDYEGEVCSWRMVAPTRERTREVHWDSENPQVDLVFVLDTTGSMGSFINYCKEQIESLLTSLTENVSIPVSCSFVSYKDFGDTRHLEVHPWIKADDISGMRQLKDFIASLGPSGGADEEEDVAGGLEKALELIKEREDKKSMKMVMLIADAPGHGYPYGRPNHGGVDQRKRLQRVIERLCSHVNGQGCEIMLTKITNSTDQMCKAIDTWLQKDKTFIDQVEVAHSGSTVFREKILAAFQSVISHAVSPPTAEGIDVYGGTDFGICEVLLNSKMNNLASRLVKEETRTEVKEGEEESKEDEASSKKSATAKKRSTAFENLVAKLDCTDYDIVRDILGALNNGSFASYEAPVGQKLGSCSVNALLNAGLTVKDLQESGYPAYIIEMFTKAVKAKLADGGAS